MTTGGAIARRKLTTTEGMVLRQRLLEARKRGEKAGIPDSLLPLLERLHDDGVTADDLGAALGLASGTVLNRLARVRNTQPRTRTTGAAYYLDRPRIPPAQARTARQRGTRRLTDAEAEHLRALHDAIPRTTAAILPPDQRAALVAARLARDVALLAAYEGRVSVAHLVDVVGISSATVTQALSTARAAGYGQGRAPLPPKPGPEPRPTASPELLAKIRQTWERLPANGTGRDTTGYDGYLLRLDLLRARKEGATLASLGDLLGITRERVRQLTADPDPKPPARAETRPAPPDARAVLAGVLGQNGLPTTAPLPPPSTPELAARAQGAAKGLVQMGWTPRRIDNAVGWPAGTTLRLIRRGPAFPATFLAERTATAKTHARSHAPEHARDKVDQLLADYPSWQQRWNDLPGDTLGKSPDSPAIHALLEDLRALRVYHRDVPWMMLARLSGLSPAGARRLLNP